MGIYSLNTGVCVAALWSAAISVTPASAQTAMAAATSGAAIEEVVVVAQKRKERLEDVPIAITALSHQTLEEHHVSDIMDLQGLSPSLEIKADDASADPKIFIRGVGLNDFNPNSTGSVGLYVDGLYVSSPLAQMGQFFDLDQVEVLRGPQGTLYGRNTTGGAINVISKKPGDEFAADASLEYGNFNAVRAEGGVGGPLIPGVLALRVAGLYQRDDGYMHNVLTGHNGDNADNWTTRATLVYTPTTHFDADLELTLGQNRGGSIWAYPRSLLPQTAAATGPDGLCLPSFFTSGQCVDALGYANTSSNLYQGEYHVEGKDIVKTFGADLTLRWTLGGVDLVSITGYQRAARNDLEDTDAGPNDLFVSRYLAQQETSSQEFRVQNHDNGGPLKWVMGLYYAYDYLNSNSSYDIFGACQTASPTNPYCAYVPPISVGVYNWPFNQTTASSALFGQVDYKITPKLSATIGLRYSNDRKSFHYTSTGNVYNIGLIDFVQADEDKTFSSLSGRLGLQYALTNHANVYVSYNRGYKSGGFFGGFTTDPNDILPYKDETLNAYEIGSKSDWFGRKLRLDVSAFYYDYRDLQVYTIITENNLPIQRFTNASNADIYGAEAELTMTPIERLNITAGLSLLHAKYVNFVSAQAGQNYSDNWLPNAPEVSFQAGVNYEHRAPFSGFFTTETDLQLRTRIFFDTTNASRLQDPERTFVNSEVGWRDDDRRLSVGLWVRNLFGTTNISDITPLVAFGLDTVAVGAPRTFGVYLRKKY